VAGPAVAAAAEARPLTGLAGLAAVEPPPNLGPPPERLDWRRPR
jgi:hypothetical protein